MRVRLPVTAIIASLILLGSGCGDDGSDPASNSTGSPEIQTAVNGLIAAAQQQAQATLQAQQASSYAQIQQAVSLQQQAQQQALQYEQTLQEAQSDQALADYYADRTSVNQEMTQLIEDQMQQAAEDRQRFEEQRLEEQRLEELLQQQREEAQRLEEQASGY